ncbi:recombinase family protein [Maritimibacter alexandrii]|uniref:recombinase family protein n=1 Tax=Maritimibacter alexandrii TaxID=2570355 RepID=UPI0011097AD3|nr:recombinase family protein [Maritimibacter alexandrii]
MTRTTIRCAIYTRKSSDEGLDQDFNSLDAQQEACAAYIASQRHEGWKRLPARYDDGGISGGTLERPALQRLLGEIDAGRVDMVVVYKIDRLTRSLADFAKLVDRLEAAGCSFVSVTQAFNTSSSMGRLTLNVLLSFAQFEREVTAERIRDKIAASKKKGLWMGGNVPLGYDRPPDGATRVLRVNPEESRTVRRLFELYADHGCLRRVEDAARREGLRSKERKSTKDVVTGGKPLSRGQIYHILRNPLYCGRIRHKDKVWPGQHDALIDDALWERVQTLLQTRSGRSRTRGGHSDTNETTSPSPAWLTGKLRDETGDRLTPTHTTKAGRRLRYYVSNRLVSGGADPTGWRLPAAALEARVLALLIAHLERARREHRLLARPDSAMADEIGRAIASLQQGLEGTRGQVAAALVDHGYLTRSEIRITLDLTALSARLGITADDLDPALGTLSAPLQIRRRGVETKIVVGEAQSDPDRHLQAMLIRAHGWTRALAAGTSLAEVARAEGCSEAFLRTRSKLAFLSPKIQAAILDGTQPPDFTLTKLVRLPLPLDWQEQERALGV